MSNSGGNLTVQYNLRWSEEMRDKIAAAAKENTRSMNQEIVARLEESFTETNLVASDPYKRMLLANIAMIVASEADNPNPSFTKAMQKITQAIMVDEKHLFDIYKDVKKAP
ncbi:Arc family DNA-binding protein [Acinetobacter indicus]|uniref:Arc family DNA-binding protein n=1 Tax=Acinetobacter indicus TaxID=756892 RepID=UPI0009491C6F|nr:Arc family DNA-binding protein [Acinetobacter indicus]